MVKNYLAVSKHKLKQLATPVYDRVFSIVASGSSYRHSFWSTVEQRIANQKHTEIHVANVNMCNAKCVFCGQHRFERPKHVMTDELFAELMVDCNDLGMGTIKEVDFTPPLGEPLLDPGIFGKASIAMNYNFRRSITTNGILLAKPDITNNVAGLFNDVRISIGGLDYSSYNKTYGVNKFGEVFVGLLDLLETLTKYYQQSSRSVKLLMRSPKSEWSLIKSDYWKRLQPYMDSGLLTVEFTNYYDNWGGSVKESDLIGVMKARKPKKKCGIPCFSLGTFFVEHQGNVRLCGCRFLNKENDGLVVGNITEQTLHKILSVDNLLPLYRKFLNPNKDESPEVCQNCTLYRPMSLLNP